LIYTALYKAVDNNDFSLTLPPISLSTINIIVVAKQKYPYD